MDTMVLVWAVRGEAEPGQEGMVPVARRVLTQLHDQGYALQVAAPVMAECLVGLERDRQADVARELAGRFEVVPFDAKAAKVFAELWWEVNGGSSLGGGPLVDLGLTRREIKFDFQLVACAVAHGARFICSNDRLLERFAGGRIAVRSLDDLDAPGQIALEIPAPGDL